MRLVESCPAGTGRTGRVTRQHPRVGERTVPLRVPEGTDGELRGNVLSYNSILNTIFYSLPYHAVV